MTASASLPLGTVDYLVFAFFIGAMVLIGFFSGRRQRKTSSGYFLAGRNLPWYAIGGSFIAANISTEQFIGMVGSTYILGVSTALWEWLNAFTYLFLIFIFVPFLLKAHIVTIPEYLAQRFGPVVRQIFAFITVIANIVIFMAAVLYTGGLALNEFFGWPLALSIALTGLFAGATAIYGGLAAVAWTGLATAVVKFVGVTCVSVLGLLAVSGDGSIVDGFAEVIRRNRADSGIWQQALNHVIPHLSTTGEYSRLSIIQGPDHVMTPWTGLFFIVVSVSIWYNVLNQFIVQRILGARSLWDARMGIVLAGYAKVFLPIVTVLPGLILFALHPQFLLGDWTLAQHQADKGFILLVKELLPVGMRGVLLAVLFSAVQATVNSVVNSTATVLTYDIYAKLFRSSEPSDQELLRFGVLTSILTVVIGILMALWVSHFSGGIFQYVQTLNAFFAPPFAALFVLSLLWKRTNTAGALAAIVGGFVVGLTLKTLGGLVEMPRWFYSFANQAAIIWMVSLMLCVLGSLMGKRHEASVSDTAVTVFDYPQVLKEGLGDKWYQSVVFWASGFFILAMILMTFFSTIFFPAT